MTKVIHENRGVGQLINGMHAQPDVDGNIEWFDVLFNEGIVRKVPAYELQELSKGTLKSYAKKALNDVSYHSFASGDTLKDKPSGYGFDMDRLKHDAKAFKRQAGVERAVDRLAKEDVDLKEKLVGKQKNIDVNHNGRIDSGDFKKLRATCSTCHHKPCTCSMKEEVVTESYGDMSHEAKELVLHGDNDSNLHFQSHRPIMDNLKKKVKKGTYNPDLATKLWQYHADRAAQSYAKQHGDGTPWHKMFTVGQRKEAAKHWEEFHRHELNESVNDHDLTEARGRPKKNPEANNEEEETAGIHGQLMKRHGGPIKFGNGETAMVTPEQKIKAVSKIRSMMGAGKSADLRDEHLAKIGKSHADFMKYAFEETEMKTTVFTESARMRGVENAVAAVLNQNLNVRKLAEETKWKKNNPGK